jgi:uncharacterized membrane protein
MLGRIIGVFITGTTGIPIAVLGLLLWTKEKINLLHDYHVDKVKPKNRKVFCKQSGIGLIVIGVGLIITAVILGITDSAYSFICFAACFAVGLIMLIAAGRKYNRQYTMISAMV